VATNLGVEPTRLRRPVAGMVGPAAEVTSGGSLPESPRGSRRAVSAPSEAWRFLRGESPLWVRANHPPIPSVATMEEGGPATALPTATAPDRPERRLSSGLYEQVPREML